MVWCLLQAELPFRVPTMCLLQAASALFCTGLMLATASKCTFVCWLGVCYKEQVLLSVQAWCLLEAALSFSVLCLLQGARTLLYTGFVSVSSSKCPFLYWFGVCYKQHCLFLYWFHVCNKQQVLFCICLVFTTSIKCLFMY